jgi:hypothetical protein
LEGRRHEYSEADVGAAQIRLVSHRIATIISSGDGCISTLTEFAKNCRTRREAFNNDAIVMDICCIERLLGYQSAEVAESCASNLEEMCRACKRLDASLILQSLCMFPAGKAFLGRVEERVCQLRKIPQEHSTIEGVFPAQWPSSRKIFSRAMTRSKVGKMARAALTIASTQLPP